METVANFRPNLHFAPQKNWMNDPNGLVYFKGEYHLFFQYNPNDSVWGLMHWGHAVSNDLISWKELDIALYPDENGTIFSGSAVVDWNNTTGFFPEEPGIVAIFTHNQEVSGEPPRQKQSLAYSHDQGRTWTKYEANPVLSHETKIDFRDPKVFWHNESKKWVMALATGKTITFYSSPNLIDWQFESEFGYGIGNHESVWECPDLFKLKVESTDEEKWVLLVSIGDNDKFDKGSRTQYFIGSFDGRTFTADDEIVRWLDFGKDNYAGVSFSDIPQEDGRRIYLGWMSNWRYANQVPTDGWRSQMTLPRELSLRHTNGYYKIVQKPVKELESYFSKKEDIDGVILNNEETVVYDMDERYIDLVTTFENIDAAEYGLVLHHTKDQYTSITVNTKEGSLVLKRDYSGEIDFSDNFSLDQVMQLEQTMNVKLHIVVDSSSIEVFVDDGEYALTSLVYPDKPCEKISFFASDGIIKLSESFLSAPTT